MVDKHLGNKEQSNDKASAQQAYIADLIKQTLLLRSKYFDGTGNLVDLSPGQNLKNIVKDLFQSDQSIQEAIQLTNSDQAKACFELLQDEMLAIFSHLLALSQHESRNKAIGHDSTHAAYDGYEILEYTTPIQDPVERVATYFGSLAHDLGRSDEVEFKGGQVNDEHHALYALMYLFQELRNHSKAFCARHPQLDTPEKEMIEKVSKALFKRVINAVLVHSGFNDTRDPVFHHVQSLDRLAGIMGQRFFVRILLADGIHLHKPLYSTSRGDYSEHIPPVQDVKSNYSIFHKMEQYMRGTFHKPVSLSLPGSEDIINERTRQSIAILYLMSGGKKRSSLHYQTFFPELNNASPEERNGKNKKGVLPEHFKNLIKDNKIFTDQEKQALEDLPTFGLEKCCRIMLQQQSMFLQENDIQNFIQYIQNNIAKDTTHQEDIIDTFRYVIIRRELDRGEEKSRIEVNIHTTDPYKAMLAQNLIQHPLRTQSLNDIIEKII